MDCFSLKELSRVQICSANYPDDAYFSADGTIAFGCRNPYKTPEKRMSFFSRDGGLNWKETENVPFSFIRLSDGHLFRARSGNQVLNEFNREQEKIPYVGKMTFADSEEAMLNGKTADEFCVIDIPELAIGYGDGNNLHTGGFDHGVLQLPNGDIIATMYGQFKSDRNRVPYIPGEYYQYRSWAVISHDGGHGFEFLSTIADANTHPLPEYAEGYCEPDLISLDDGSLLCAMRSGGFFEGGAEHYTPAYSCRSFDGGKSWSKPNEINSHGVFPRLVQTENGAVVCASGRDGVYLSVSADRGESWGGPLYLSRNHGKWGRVPSGYSSMGVTGKNIITLVWDDGCEEWYEGHESDPNGSHSRIYASRFEVVLR